MISPLSLVEEQSHLRWPHGPRCKQRTRRFYVVVVLTSVWVFGGAVLAHSQTKDPSPPSAMDWLSTLGTALSPTLTTAIQQGRDHVYPQGQPIPAAIRQKLAPFFSSALLRKVRYSIDWQDVTEESALAALLLGTGAEAVTLGDVIIFRDAQHAADPILWAHELTHVEQYERLGIPAFATQYLQQGWQMEQEARAKASKIQQQLAR